MKKRILTAAAALALIAALGTAGVLAAPGQRQTARGDGDGICDRQEDCPQGTCGGCALGNTVGAVSDAKNAEQISTLSLQIPSSRLQYNNPKEVSGKKRDRRSSICSVKSAAPNCQTEQNFVLPAALHRNHIPPPCLAVHLISSPVSSPP